MILFNSSGLRPFFSSTSNWSLSKASPSGETFSGMRILGLLVCMRMAMIAVNCSAGTKVCWRKLYWDTRKRIAYSIVFVPQQTLSAIGILHVNSHQLDPLYATLRCAGSLTRSGWSYPAPATPRIAPLLHDAFVVLGSRTFEKPGS
jgi:hypothetical protein